MNTPGSAASVPLPLRERCRDLGLPVWRCDTGGAIVEEPIETGLVRLWLVSRDVSALISAAAAAWSGQPEPQVASPLPGCWLIPIPEEIRGRRTGLTIAMALAPEILTGAAFADICRSGGLDEHAARATVARLATHDASSVRAAARALRWAVQDVAALGEQQSAVDGFTAELGQSYETIDLLYSLGRSMLDPHRPENFIALVCDRLFETMSFGWLAAKFLPDTRWGAESAPWQRTHVRGHPPAGLEDLDAAMGRLAQQADRQPFLAPDSDPLSQPSRVLVQPVRTGQTLAGLLVCGNKSGPDPQISSYDMQLLEAASGYVGAFLQNAALYQEQQAMFLGSLKALTAAIDAKDRYTMGHSERVAMLASRLALAAGLDSVQAGRIHICGLVHDVGKIGVPEAVLCKAGRLTEAEFRLVREHPAIGHTILKDIPMLQDVLPGVLHHHERFDGKGYPHGLSGTGIPLYARILALADTFDAMSSNRSYRPAMPREQVLAEISRCAGTQFDPDLAAAFLKVDLGQYDLLVQQHAQAQAPAALAA